MGKEERKERRKECDLKRERKGGKAFRKREMESRKEIQRRFREKEGEIAREGDSERDRGMINDGER